MVEVEFGSVVSVGSVSVGPVSLVVSSVVLLGGNRVVERVEDRVLVRVMVRNG